MEITPQTIDENQIEADSRNTLKGIAWSGAALGATCATDLGSCLIVPQVTVAVGMAFFYPIKYLSENVITRDIQQRDLCILSALGGSAVTALVSKASDPILSGISTVLTPVTYSLERAAYHLNLR